MMNNPVFDIRVYAEGRPENLSEYLRQITDFGAGHLDPNGLWQVIFVPRVPETTSRASAEMAKMICDGATRAAIAELKTRVR